MPSFRQAVPDLKRSGLCCVPSHLLSFRTLFSSPTTHIRPAHADRKCTSHLLIVAAHTPPLSVSQYRAIAPHAPHHHEFPPTQAVDVRIEAEEIDGAQPEVEGGLGTAENKG